jgi:hypothetical protein
MATFLAYVKGEGFSVEPVAAVVQGKEDEQL